MTNQLLNSVSLPSSYSEVIHMSRYARWIEEEGRRELWHETVDRYVDFMQGVARKRGMEEPELFREMREMILNQEVMPSMRAFMTAGAALERDNVAGFNCSFVAIDHMRAFDEVVYILMCGTGVGFSCERQVIAKLPEVCEFNKQGSIKIVVGDSKRGWAQAYRELIECLYAGIIPEWDVSQVRPAGARLKIFGGRASGPQPLVDLFKFTIAIFKNAAGRRLESTEVHDIICKIGDVVVVGGVRRSALISLSNLSDQRMRDAKSGEWWNAYPHRRLANNSVAYTEKPEVGQFMEEWNALYRSKSGERGIFNREAAIKQSLRFGREFADDETVGTNPCGEILLRSGQFCNLTEIVARNGDTRADFERKATMATIMGTLQSSLTDFEYLRPKWKKNTEEEALLGVSITGIMDCDLLNGTKLTEDMLSEMLIETRELIESVNEQAAERLGINKSKAMTCVKPSGTVSQLVDSASGIHTRHSEFYIRRIRNDSKDPVTDFLIENGIPHEPDTYSPGTMVFSFPIRSPKAAATRKDQTAIQALENWLIFKRDWCHHNPSVTINVREEEWPEVGAWVWNHFDEVGGLSFLPHSEHTYQQAPYEEVTEEELEKLEAIMPETLDWMTFVEKQDNTVGSQEMACSAGGCEIR